MIAGFCLVAAAAQGARHLFVGEPELDFGTEGQVTVRWQSSEPLPPGRINYGVTLPDDPYREPRFRFASVEQGDSLRSEHEATIYLRAIQYPLLDASGQRQAGGGEVELRLQLYRPGSRALYLHYFRFAYASGGDSWQRMPCLVSGPWIDRVGPREAWLSWDLDMAAELLLEYGPAPADVPGAGSAAASSAENAVASGDAPGWQRRRLPAARHGEIRLEGLEPGRRYEYSLQVLAAQGRGLPARRWSFETAPETGHWPADGIVRIAFMSDSRGGPAGIEESVEGTNRELIRRIMIQAERAGADLILFGGDLIDGYTADPTHYRRQLAAWKQAAECVGPRLPIYQGMGNHEMLADDFSAEGAALTSAYRDRAGPENSESLFAEAFVNPENGPQPPSPESPPFRENVYSFDRGPVHVVAMNNSYDISNHPDSLGGYREGFFPDEELAWLERDLREARARGQQEIIVFAHEPAFPCAGHSGDAMYWGGRYPEVLAMRARFWEILMRHGVRVTFYGDEHNYSRLRLDTRLDEFYEVPVWQIVSGGVGAPFYYLETDLPWSPLVAAFSAVHHFCLLELSSAGVSLTVIDSFGRVIDRADLD